MFFLEDNKNSRLIILAIFVLMALRHFTQTDLVGLILTLPSVLIAITFHEYAHAWAATKLGDDTPERQGRLNLNPLSHIDPVGFVLLLFAGFGWGKPVQINPRNFYGKYSMETGEAIVSAAGPLMNFILAIVFAIINYIVIKFAPVTFTVSELGFIITGVINYTIITNIGLGVFNLIPLPPLDGSKIFRKFLPYNAKIWIDEHENIFYFIFLAIWITGIAGIIITPIIKEIYGWLMTGVALLFGFKIV